MLHRIPGGVRRLGTAAALTAGTAPFNAVQLDASGKLPPVDGSQLTGLSSGSGNLSNLVVDVTAHGVVGDGVLLTDGATTTGTATFSSASAAFTAADVGKTITIEGAGAAGVTLTTTISAYISATSVTLSVNAGATVSAAYTHYGTDNATALNTMFAAVKNGVTILFPTGMYLFGSQLDLSTLENTTLRGTGRTRSNLINAEDCSLVFIGTGAGNALRLADVRCVTIENINLTYSSSGFTGVYCWMGNTGTRDAAYILIQGCSFVSHPTTATAWLHFDKAELCAVRDCSFWYSTHAIQLGIVTGSYVNSLLIDSCVFLQQGGFPIWGGEAQSLAITNNTFEPCSDGAGRLMSAPSSVYTIWGLVLTGNWVGDSTVAGTLINIAGTGLHIAGNFFSGIAGATCLYFNGVNGFSIHGNQFYTWGTALNYAAASNGGVFQGNNLHSVTTTEGSTANKGTAVTTNSNSSV